jgi:death-associated protein kinase
VCFGCDELTQVLQLGIDISVEQFSVNTRRQLAEILDPPDAMGRDWSILAVKLGMPSAVSRTLTP